MRLSAQLFPTAPAGQWTFINDRLPPLCPDTDPCCFLWVAAYKLLEDFKMMNNIHGIKITNKTPLRDIVKHYSYIFDERIELSKCDIGKHGLVVATITAYGIRTTMPIKSIRQACLRGDLRHAMETYVSEMRLP